MCLGDAKEAPAGVVLAATVQVEQATESEEDLCEDGSQWVEDVETHRQDRLPSTRDVAVTTLVMTLYHLRQPGTAKAELR